MARIDPHTHLLPGVDDGCRGYADSLAVARRLVGNGYARAVCSSHYGASWGLRPRGQVRDDVDALQRVLDEEGVPLKLHAGGELSLMASCRRMAKDDFLPLGEGNAVLFDTWAPTEPRSFYDDVERIKDHGFQPVLAHPERIEFISRSGGGTYGDLGDGQVDKLAERGVLLQCNLECLALDPSTDARRQSERWLREGRYHMLGSDTHRPEKMDTRMQGLRNALDWLGADEVKRLTETNPARLLNVSL